ncbi:MAG: hypothetical protein J0I47_02155 [Sphingomonas sp.]|uniref:hypothetical protein n=1 Tax=Sphingomonas sp. TaxID=28214 RepID=UPI001AC287BE|nr:hypothetical protein [Sphingomonas sp.]MBN8807032.1 hypothetical protein [Sphingomonas sp.]
MSLSEKDRKLQSETGKEFQNRASTEPLVTAIAAALKEEFGNKPAALKTVARLTRSNERAVRNWFEAKNGPSAENLVVLMRHSDLILRTVLALADRRDLVMAVGLATLRRHLIDTVAAIDGLPQDPPDAV